MLVSAISTENAKLQSGGAGSVAQVAESARIDMKRIHDDNLPVSEMIKLMKATRQEGGNRIKALNDTRNEIKQRMGGGTAPAVMDSKPAATQHKGQVLYGHGNEAGKSWKSNGKNWVEVK
jgi:hypothetical protein